MKKRSNFLTHIATFFIIIASLISAVAANAESEANAELIYIGSYDGRSAGEKYTGSWISVKQSTIDGKPIARAIFSFELSGDYGVGVNRIGISSSKTTPSLAASVSMKIKDGLHGNRFWIQGNNGANFRRMFRSLDRQDQEVIFVICSIMSKPSFVYSAISRMLEERRQEPAFVEFWRQSTRVWEVNRIADRCLSDLKGMFRFSDSATTKNNVSTVDRVRAAQAILAEMGVYDQAIDGVAGPRTERAVRLAMVKMEVKLEPTVQNFMTTVLERIRVGAIDPALPDSTASLEELRRQNAQLVTDLENTKSKLAILEASMEVGSETADATGANELGRARNSDQKEAEDIEPSSTLIAELEMLRPLAQEVRELQELKNTLERQLSAANETVADLREGIALDERIVEVQAQLDAANATIADLRAEIGSSYVSRADYEALQRQISALSTTNAEYRAKVEQDFVARTDHVAALSEASRIELDLRGQLGAANQTVAELRERINLSYVPIAEYAATRSQLEAAESTVVELRKRIQVDFVSKSDFAEVQRVLAAANETVAELRLSLETDFVALLDYQKLERQISALNSTILELQDRNELQRNRMLESEALFRNFRDDCAAINACAKAMKLE